MAASGWSARQGLITAASVVLALLMAAALGLQGLWWAAISAWVVSNPDFTALWRKAGMRLAGTAVGLSAGYVLAVALEGIPLFQALALFIICAVGSYLRFASRYGYAWFYGTITLMLMLAVSILETGALFSFAENRFLEIACGVVASAVIHAAGRPRAAPAPAAPVQAVPHTADLPNPDLHTADLDLTHIALVAGVSAVGMVALWSWFDLPSLPQAIGSALAVLDRDFGSMRARAPAVSGLRAGGRRGTGRASAPARRAPGLPHRARRRHLLLLPPAPAVGLDLSAQGGIAFITALVTDGGPRRTAAGAGAPGRHLHRRDADARGLVRAGRPAPQPAPVARRGRGGRRPATRRRVTQASRNRAAVVVTRPPVPNPGPAQPGRAAA